MRQDLRYRLGVVEITLPPLRDRRSDLPLLIRHFLERFNEKYGKKIEGLSPEAEKMLLSYSYPGNVRELMNVIHRTVLLSHGRIIEAASLPEEIRRQDAAPHPAYSGAPSAAGPGEAGGAVEKFKLAKQRVVEAFERDFLAQALRSTRGNVTRAAKTIGLDVKNFRFKMKQYGLAASSFK